MALNEAAQRIVSRAAHAGALDRHTRFLLQHRIADEVIHDAWQQAVTNDPQIGTWPSAEHVFTSIMRRALIGSETRA